MTKTPAKGEKNNKKTIESRSGCSAFFLPKNSQHFELCTRVSEIQFCRITVYAAKCVLDNLAAIWYDEEHLLLENRITVNGLSEPFQNDNFKYKLLAGLNAKSLEKRQVSGVLCSSVSERRSVIKSIVVTKQ